MYTHESVESEPREGGAPTDDELVSDLFSQRCADDPHAVYHEVQAQCPVHRGAGMFGGHSVNVASYADVRWALRHPEVFSSKDVVNIGNDAPWIRRHQRFGRCLRASDVSSTARMR